MSRRGTRICRRTHIGARPRRHRRLPAHSRSRRWCSPSTIRCRSALDIRVINKVSQNLHAEMLLRLLGREKGSSGSVAAGLEVLRGFLTQAGLAPEEYVFYDGCGLSRHDLVSPRATVKLLRYAARQPWGAEFIDSLPLAGVDGTLASRFQTLPAGPCCTPRPARSTMSTCSPDI